MNRMTTAAKRAKATKAQIAEWSDQVIDRLDSKPETVDIAVEAVTGHGNGPVFEALKAYVNGQ